MKMSPEERLECLSHASLFAWLDAAQVALLAGEAEPRFYKEGDVIFDAGSMGDGLYLIAAGEVTFSSGPHNDYDNQQASTLEAGNYFGELSLLDWHARNSMARATLPTTLLHFSPSILKKLSASRPEQHAIIMTNLAREMARKIRLLNRSKTVAPSNPSQP